VRELRRRCRLGCCDGERRLPLREAAFAGLDSLRAVRAW
jgi:hypothetical protein